MPAFKTFPHESLQTDEETKRWKEQQRLVWSYLTSLLKQQVDVYLIMQHVLACTSYIENYLKEIICSKDELYNYPLVPSELKVLNTRIKKKL